jgi:hypothetical protein
VSTLAAMPAAELDSVRRRLDPEERAQWDKALLGMQDERYKADPAAFLLEQCLTRDENSRTVRRWKDAPYVRDMIDALNEFPMLGFPKTRRMFATWAAAGWVVHQTRYFPSTATFWQSENELKSAFAVDQRCYFIERTLRTPGLRRPVATIKTNGGLVGRMTYFADRPDNSYIWGLPRNPETGRTFTPSIWVMDEIEFMEHPWQTFETSLPFTEKGGRLILISTSNGPSGVLAGLCKEAGFIRFGGPR